MQKKLLFHLTIGEMLDIFQVQKKIIQKAPAQLFQMQVMLSISKPQSK
jgi:hypothetical protein